MGYQNLNSFLRAASYSSVTSGHDSALYGASRKTKLKAATFIASGLIPMGPIF